MNSHNGKKVDDMLNKDNSSDHKSTIASPSASGEGSASTAMRTGNVSALSTSLSGKITPTPLRGINELDATTASYKSPLIQPQSSCPDSMANTLKDISMPCQVQEQPQVDTMDRPMTEAEDVFYFTLYLLYQDIKRWLPSLTISDKKTPCSQMELASDSGLVDDSIRPEVQEKSSLELLRGVLSDLRLSTQLGESIDSDITTEDAYDSTNHKESFSANWIIAKKLEEFFLPILRKYKGTQTGSSGSPSDGIDDVASGHEKVYDFFASELAKMEEMGFRDVTSNMIALMWCAFDVEKAVLWILKIHNPHVMM